MNLALWLWRTAARRPDAPALFTGDQCAGTYAEFAQRAATIGARLRDVYGVEPGDRVAIFLTNRIDYLPILFGIWAAGGVAVPVNAKLHPRELLWILEDTEARLVVISEPTSGTCRLDADLGLSSRSMLTCETISTWPVAEGWGDPVERGRDDLAWLFYTSGTTGRPKGVMLSHGNLQAMAHAYIVDVDEPGPAATTIYAAPLSHGAGLYSVIHVLRGSRHVVPASGGFEPAELVDLAAQFGNVSLFGAPTMVKRLVDHCRSVGSNGEGLQTVIYGGGPMYTSDIEEAVAALGPRFIQIYGQGESPMTITTLDRERVADRKNPCWRERLASVGVPFSYCEVRIADGDGNSLAPGNSGEILVRGPQIMRGYWNNPDANTQTLRGGWLWTGDIGVMDEEGFLTLKDRSKDVIISGGANIYPREVEEALLACADVSEVCVLGRPHPDWGEEIVAFVVPHAGKAPAVEALDRYCTERIARFKRPKQYRFVSDLPKNNYGKVLKSVLREQLAKEGTVEHGL